MAHFCKMKWIIFLGLFWLAGCSTYPKAVEPSSTLTHEHLSIHVVSHGWHTGVIFPASMIYERFPQLSARFSRSKFIEIGWGDSGFYQTNEITSGLTVRAIFTPTESVVHVVGFSAEPEKYFTNSDVKEVVIDKAHLKSLLAFIHNSFKRDAKGQLVELKSGLYGNSQFYSGIGDYHLFNTCNKWTAKALYSGGVSISPMFKLTSSSVIDGLHIIEP